MRTTNGDTTSMITEALERYLEDWEDYTDAVQICAEVDAGRMRTYTQEEIDREIIGLHQFEQNRLGGRAE